MRHLRVSTSHASSTKTRLLGPGTNVICILVEVHSGDYKKAITITPAVEGDPMPEENLCEKVITGSDEYLLITHSSGVEMGDDICPFPHKHLRIIKKKAYTNKQGKKQFIRWRMFTVNIIRQLEAHWGHRYKVRYCKGIVKDENYIKYLAKKDGYSSIKEYLESDRELRGNKKDSMQIDDDIIDRYVRSMPRATTLAIQVALQDEMGRDFAMASKDRIEFTKKTIAFQRTKLATQINYCYTEKYMKTVLRQFDTAEYRCEGESITPSCYAKLARLTYHLMHVVPRAPYACGDELRGLLVIGDKERGKTSAFCTLRAHRIATDASGVGRYKCHNNEEAIFLDDWTAKKLTGDDTTTLRTLCLGKPATIKVYASTEDTAPLWVAGTSNDEPQFSAPDKRRWWVVKFTLRLKGKLINPDPEKVYAWHTEQALELLEDEEVKERIGEAAESYRRSLEFTQEPTVDDDDGASSENSSVSDSEWEADGTDVDERRGRDVRVPHRADENTREQRRDAVNNDASIETETVGQGQYVFRVPGKPVRPVRKGRGNNADMANKYPTYLGPVKGGSKRGASEGASEHSSSQKEHGKQRATEPRDVTGSGGVPQRDVLESDSDETERAVASIPSQNDTVHETVGDAYEHSLLQHAMAESDSFQEWQDAIEWD